MSSSRNKLGIILGAILIGAGALFLIAELTGLASFGLLWPMIIMLVGAGFFIGMFIGGPEAGGLAIPGSIILTVGLILLIQNAFDLWITWSYAWALIISAVGLGLVIFGAYSDKRDLRESGVKLINLGLVLFVVFGLIASLLWNAAGVTNTGYGFFGLMMSLIGLYLLIHRAYLLIKGRAGWDDRDLFWPVIMIGVGLVFFMFELGGLSLVQLTGLRAWWPLLLIMIGLDWLVGRRWPWVGALLAVIVVTVSLLMMFDPAFLRLIITG